LLSVRESVGLRAVNKALKALVVGWPVRLGNLLLRERLPAGLEAPLTRFPAAESVSILFEEALAPAEESRMVELLRRQGGTLKKVKASRVAEVRLLSSAVRAGALPNLT
jgi:hypothetical protein